MAIPLLSTTRNEVVERLERGHCVIADASGSVIWSVGNPDHVTYLRSSAKPLQAAALVLSGAIERFGLADANVAVACGSHRGEPGHVRAVLDTLSRAGVSPDALGCGTHPLNHAEGFRLAADGQTPTPLHNNCSGKHAGMLAAATALGAPIDTYLDPAHPVQRQILDTVATCAGVPAASIHVGIDGCSAPNFALPMRTIARCFANIARANDLPADLCGALACVRSAMQAQPWFVSGTGQFDTLVMDAMPGAVIAKGGAEALHCVALPSLGLGVAVKFESGRPDGIASIVLAILRAAGVFGSSLPSSLQPFYRPVVLNHREIVVGRTQVLIDEALSKLRELNLARA